MTHKTKNRNRLYPKKTNRSASSNHTDKIQLSLIKQKQKCIEYWIDDGWGLPSWNSSPAVRLPHTWENLQSGGDAVRTDRVVVRGGFRSVFWRRRRREDRESRRPCWFRSVFWRRRRQTPEETPWGESSSFVVSRRFDRLLGGEDEKPRQKKKNKETKKEKKF